MYIVIEQQTDFLEFLLVRMSVLARTTRQKFSKLSSLVNYHVEMTIELTPEFLSARTLDLAGILESQICSCFRSSSELTPPKKLLGSGFGYPYTPFCLICTISSELKCISYVYLFEWAGDDIRWFSVDGVDTRWIPRSFSCGCAMRYNTVENSRNSENSRKSALLILLLNYDAS